MSETRHLPRIFVIAAILSFACPPAVYAQDTKPQWYRCIVKAASHTGRYTFRISTNPCAVYWHEIDADLKIRDCNGPEIAALKPSATDNLSIVWFNMKTGAFYDYLSGVKDRGICTKITSVPETKNIFMLRRHPCEGLYSK